MTHAFSFFYFHKEKGYPTNSSFETNITEMAGELGQILFLSDNQ